MRVFFCGNGSSAAAIARYLKERGDAHLVGCAVHPSERARNVEDIRECCGAPTLLGSEINSAKALRTLKRIRPDVLLSVHFGYIFRNQILQLVPHALNVHPGYLPYGRGANPNVWAIVEETPAGVTIHYMTQALDAGEILAQKKVPYDWTDTGETLYRRLLAAEVELFVETWPRFLAGELEPRPQHSAEATYHTTKDLAGVDRLRLDEEMSVRSLLNRLRARTFPPYDGCYVETDGGRRTYFRLSSYQHPEEAARS